jgi:hypothetical protein
VQNYGIAISATSSNMIAEIFLQHTENLHIANLTNKHSIVNYFRYVDVILITFDSNQTNIQALLKDFNAIHHNIQFTEEMEANCTINYLVFYIQKNPNSWITLIYRKPTFTDTVISYTSNHPIQHKYAVIRFQYNRLNSFDLQNMEHQHEENIIHNIFATTPSPST